MVRKLALAVALALSVTPLGVHALGVGDIHLKSRLNQKLDAEIELVSVQKGTLTSVKATLAPPEAFERAGVPRPFILAKLRFDTERKPDGNAVIKITSREPISEPYLRFLVEVNWPKGKVVREYNLVLDPVVQPVRQYTTEPSYQYAAPLEHRGPTTAAAPSPAPVAAVTPTSRRAERHAAGGAVATGGNARGEVKDGSYGPTQPNDTLWSIAARVAPPGVEVHQMVIALQRANPGAFAGGNINNLRAGEILRIPSAEEAAAVPAGEAHTEYRRQLSQWGGAPAGGARQAAEPSATPPVGAEGAAGKPKAPTAKHPPRDELKIAAPAPDEKGAAGTSEETSAKGTIQRLKQELQTAQETAESAKRESEELRSRVGDLQSQMNDMKRLITLKDDQLAKLQASLAAPQEDVAAAPKPAPAPHPQPKPEAAPPPAQPAHPATSQPAATAPVQPPAQPVEPAPAHEPKPAPVPAPEPKPAPPPEAKPTPPVEHAPPPAQPEPPKPKLKPKPEPEPKPAPAPAPATEGPGIVDTVLEVVTNPFVLGGGGLAIGGGLGGWWFMRRRRKGALEDQESILTSVGEDTGDSDREGPLSGLTTEETSFLDSLSSTGDFTITGGSLQTGAGGDEETSFLSDFVPSDIESLQEETGDVDPLAEADVYIAYGRYKQAEELIRQAMSRHPEKAPLRLKLFEILHATKDQAGFTRLLGEPQSAELQYSDPESWDHIQEMKRDLAGVGGAPAAPAKPMAELGGLDLDALDRLAASGGEKAGSGTLDDLDLDLDLGGAAAPVAQAPAKTSPAKAAPAEEEHGLGDLDFGDLMGDFGGTATPEPKKPAASAAGGDLGFDLDLDLGLTASGASQTLGEVSLADQLSGGMGGEDFGLDLGELGSTGGPGGIPDLGQQIAAEPGEMEGLEVTGMNKPAKGEKPAAELFDLGGELGDFNLDDLGLSTEVAPAKAAPAKAAPPPPPPPPAAAAGGGEAVSEEEVATKIDLAKAYIDMADEEGARDILGEVLAEGTAAQRKEAEALLAQLG